MSKVWIVTGASAGGIGEGIVRAALKAGENVVGTARSLKKLEGIAKDYPDTFLPVVLDVTDKDQIDACVKATLDKFGTIDVLVNNAGYGYRSSVEEGEDQGIQDVYNTNLFGPINMIKAVLPTLRAKKSGAILNTTSIAAERSAVGSAFYASSKAALDLLTDGLMKELKPLGIRVMVIEPGAFRTNFYSTSLKGAKMTISDYKDTAWTKSVENTHDTHQQAGDPIKGGQVVYDMVNAEDAPFRLILGKAAVDVVVATAEGRIEEAKKYADISAKCDF